MPFILTLIVGGAAGMLVAHFLRLELNIYVSMALGVIGTVLGVVLMRSFVALSAGLNGAGALFIAGLIGSVVLVVLIRLIRRRK